MSRESCREHSFALKDHEHLREDTMTNDATPSPPSNVADLVKRVQREWSALLHVVKSASHERMCTPGPDGWSVKDVLAHLADWERFLLLNQFQEHSPHEALQVDEIMLERPDFDELNATLFERNRDRPIADVLVDLHQTHSQLLVALEQMSDSDLTKPVDAIFKAVPLIAVVRSITYHHYREHRGMIEAILNE